MSASDEYHLRALLHLTRERAALQPVIQLIANGGALSRIQPL